MAGGTRTIIYQVTGIHCRSCELVIEDKVSRLKGVKSVSVSARKGTIEINTTPGREPSFSRLNRLFKGQNYCFCRPRTSSFDSSQIINLSLLAIILTGLFIVINRFGLFSGFNVTSRSLPPAFFIFGLLAGFSACAALTGGLLLTLQKQWGISLTPTLAFNFGRLLFFTLAGGLLALLGSVLQISLTVSSILSILFSLFIIGLALQMIGLKWFSRFQLALPKSFTQKVVAQTQSTKKIMPFLLGSLTFFLPCGFTLTSQALALSSGSFFTGAQILFFFSLGTFVPLSLIGLLGSKISQSTSISKYLSPVAGILVLLFSLSNISSQLQVLAVIPSTQNLPDRQASLTLGIQDPNSDDLPPLINGFQILTMTASAAGYSPSNLKVKAGIPVRWEIADTGTNGCTSAIVARSLFPDSISLTPGTTSVKEFTPSSPETYRFSCWMGMVVGSITVLP